MQSLGKLTGSISHSREVISGEFPSLFCDVSPIFYDVILSLSLRDFEFIGVCVSHLFNFEKFCFRKSIISWVRRTCLLVFVCVSSLLGDHLDFIKPCYGLIDLTGSKEIEVSFPP